MKTTALVKQTIVNSITPSRQHWKDAAAGWKVNYVSGDCPKCGKHCRITIEGTKEQAQKCIDENRALCDPCADE